MGAINGLVEDFRAAYREAQEHLRLGMQGAAGDPNTLYFCGAAYLYSGQFEQAVRVLRNSLDLNPHQSDPTGGTSQIYGWYRGIVFGCEGRYEEAIELIRDFIEHHLRYGAARVTLALDHAAIGQMDEARAMVEHAHREDPGVFVDGMSLMVGAHPDPEVGKRRMAMLHSLWPGH